MATYRIAVLPGDGIGQEVIPEAMRVLGAIGKGTGAAFEFERALVGGAAIDATGAPLASGTLELCRASHAILFGAVGGPKWDDVPHEQRPERGLLALRKELDLYANLRPAKCFPMLVDASPLKREVVEGTDLMVIRELTGGLYFGEPRGVERFADGGARAINTMAYTSREVERIARMGFEVARKRRRRLTSVDKVNVLVVSQLWREVVTSVGREYPDVTLDHLLVDNCAMALVHRPTQFDTIVTENTFGDILSDEAAILAGSMGMLPSASLGGSVGLYEPVHGTAPDIAGKGIANPIAAILSAAMLLRYSLNLEKDADRIDHAVLRVLEQGHRTADIAAPGATPTGTRAMGEMIVRAGATVIDRSNAFRRDPDVPLVGPELNAHAARGHHGIRACPNCTTIVTVMPLKPLHDAGRLTRVIATSFQAVSGAGVNGIAELREQTLAWARGEAMVARHFPHQIAFNLVPAIDRFGPDGYTAEEMKLVNETRKILETPGLPVAPTTVRVPVFTSHSISITAETETKITAGRARDLFARFPGLKLWDDPAQHRYPMPIAFEGQDDCFVGRIREDLSSPNGLSFWVVGDQLRKGAATNAVQIAELLLQS